MDSWTVASSFLLIGLASCAALSAFDTGKSKTFPPRCPEDVLRLLASPKFCARDEMFNNAHRVDFEDRLFVLLPCFRTSHIRLLQNFIQNSSASLREDFQSKPKMRSVLVFSVVDRMLLLMFLMSAPCS